MKRWYSAFHLTPHFADPRVLHRIGYSEDPEPARPKGLAQDLERHVGEELAAKPAVQGLIQKIADEPDPQKRAELFDKLDRWREKRSDASRFQGVSYDENEDEDERSVAGEYEVGRIDRHTELVSNKKITKGKKRVRNAAVRSSETGWSELGNDEQAIRAFLGEQAQAAGYSLDALTAPNAPGRPSAAEAARRQALAAAVREAIERGAVQEAIGRVSNRDKRRISELAA